ncbi:MSMEG_0570 family nitrogen starvation response protein [Rhodococcus sp. UNC23MFCrub1.1]|uniref:MSMEG_0570 family nitrogen starvation response protein n=1 Tax=Rhodococcus sp. UNC23MFCrub1.1 TaxID=1449068 RepID=UPI00055AA88D|nr:MSMEG_0570 family nitrogen starvation response protein [Rhodococcus sp. UNC23MFCrub1.1]
MPEMTFTVQWPNGCRQQCYSPSLVVRDHLTVGMRYEIADFVQRSRLALTEASDRVRAKYGFACTSAAATLREIETTAAAFDHGTVHVLDLGGAR